MLAIKILKFLSYGFQTHTKLRMVLSVALVDAMIKDADIVAVS